MSIEYIYGYGTSIVPKGDLRNSNLKGYKALINGEVYRGEQGFKKENLFFNNGRLLTQDVFEKTAKSTDEVEIIDLKNKLVTPALVDQHIHGGYGMDFNTANEEEMRNFLRETKKMGQGAVLATFVSDTIDNLNKQMDIVRNIMANPKNDETEILGINLEGPFLSKKKSGIHAQEVIMKPTVDNLKKLNLEGVKMMTIAPEEDEGYKASQYLIDKGIIVSAGHSVASAKQVRNSGATQVTHIFNAMSGLHHRVPTIANEGLFNDNIAAEVICTPEHLDSNIVNMVMKMKPQDKIILISDALCGTNIKDDHFKLGGKDIYIQPDGTAKDKEGVIAGSIKLLSQTAKNLTDTTNMNFADFIKYSSVNPARNLGVEEDYVIEENATPNITIWDKETLLPEKTYIKGE